MPDRIARRPFKGPPRPQDAHALQCRTTAAACCCTPVAARSGALARSAAAREGVKVTAAAPPPPAARSSSGSADAAPASGAGAAPAGAEAPRCVRLPLSFQGEAVMRYWKGLRAPPFTTEASRAAAQEARRSMIQSPTRPAAHAARTPTFSPTPPTLPPGPGPVGGCSCFIHHG